MFCGAMSFAIMSVLGNLLSKDLNWTTVGLGRCIVPMLIVGPLALLAGKPLLIATNRMLWVRCISGSVSIALTFFALCHLPTADVLALTNLSPIWIAALSGPMLGHSPGLTVWLCVLTAVIGAGILQQPHFAAGNFATVAAFASSLTSTIAVLGLNQLRNVDPRTILFQFSFTAAFALLGCAWFWNLPVVPDDVETMLRGVQIWRLVGVGLFATIGQFCLTQAFVHGLPARVSVVGLSQVVFAMLFDVLLLSRSVSLVAGIGTALVLIPTAYVLTLPSAKRLPGKLPPAIDPVIADSPAGAPTAAENPAAME